MACIRVDCRGGHNYKLSSLSSRQTHSLEARYLLYTNNKSACSNGATICKELGLSPTYNQCIFSPVTSFFHTPIESNAKICVTCPNKVV